MNQIEKWASNIRAEMARKEMKLGDLAQCIKINNKKPSIATVSRWIKGNCTLKMAHEIERVIDNWEPK